MSSRKVGGNGMPVNSSSKGNNISETSNPEIQQLSHDVKDISLGTGDGWEVYVKKSKNKAGSSASKQSVPQISNSRAWGHPDVVQKLGWGSSGGSGRGGGNSWPTLPTDSRRPAGRGNDKPQSFNQISDGNQVTPTPAVVPPPKHGWNWSTRAVSTHLSGEVPEKNKNVQNPGLGGKENAKTSEADADADDDYYDSDTADEFDDDVLSDESDSDSSEKSHETRKKHRWLKELFECMDGLTVEQINDGERQWHCPACKDGPGAIDWFRGLQPLIAHAKTKGATRVKLHRELAQLLEEELRRRGTSAVPAGEMFGKWEGLDERTEKEIVWPPMAVIMNTRHDKDDNDKWIGMGNQELLDYFSSYAAVKARHSYGPQGHRGMSLLVFEASAVGYLEAERLSKHFEDNGRDRDSWEHKRVPSYSGGKRQLYGYMAEKRDLDSFNYHCQGKSKLKFEIRSYQEMVVKQLKQMSEDNQQLIWFKNRVAKEQLHSKALEESYGLVSEKLRKTQEENRIVRLRTKMHHEQNKEEMDYQEQFFKDQIKMIYDARDAKEDDFEKMQQEQREKITQQSRASPSIEDPRVSDYEHLYDRAEAIAKSVKLQDKEMEEFVAQREKLMKSHEQRMLALKSRHLEEELALKRRHWDEEVAVEEEFNMEESKLMEKYTPSEHGAAQ